MKLIVGLGNPGSAYDGTRHNVGFVVIDRLIRRHAPTSIPKGRFSAMVVEAMIGSEKCLLSRPTTFMNLSGQSVGEALRFYKLDASEDLLVFTDDVALPVGMIRLRQRGSAGGHNGLGHIEQMLGSQEYGRCRIGIDPVPPQFKQADYVLGKFTPEQHERLGPAIDAAADAAEVFIAEGMTPAMNRFNKRNSPGPEPEVEPGWLSPESN